MKTDYYIKFTAIKNINSLAKIRALNIDLITLPPIINLFFKKKSKFVKKKIKATMKNSCLMY